MTMRGAGAVRCNDLYYERKSSGTHFPSNRKLPVDCTPAAAVEIVSVSKHSTNPFRDLQQSLIQHKANSLFALNFHCWLANKVNKVLSEAQRPTAISVYPKQP